VASFGSSDCAVEVGGISKQLGAVLRLESIEDGSVSQNLRLYAELEETRLRLGL
jgi:hypothetical protein